MLAAICQAATSVEPSRNISTTGAVKGKIVRATQTGLFGNSISKDENQSGETASSTKIVASCCPSRVEAVIEPMPVEITANNK